MKPIPSRCALRFNSIVRRYAQIVNGSGCSIFGPAAYFDAKLAYIEAQAFIAKFFPQKILTGKNLYVILRLTLSKVAPADVPCPLDDMNGDGAVL